MDGDTLATSTESIPQFVEALIAEKRDLRVALTWAIILLRHATKDLYPFLLDALELRASKFDDFDDLKLYFAQKKKEREDGGPFGLMRRMMEGGL